MPTGQPPSERPSLSSASRTWSSRAAKRDQAGRETAKSASASSAARQPGSLGGQALGFTTRVFPLRHIDAKSAAEAVRELVGRGGVVVPSPSGNSLLVADYADNLRRLRELIARLDVDNSRAEVIRLRNSSAREIAQVVDNLYGGQRRGGHKGFHRGSFPCWRKAWRGRGAVASRRGPSFTRA